MAIAFDVAASGSGPHNTVSFSVAFSGADRYALIAVACADDYTVSSVTVGGSAATSLGTATHPGGNTDSYHVALYGFVAPPTGGVTVEATTTAGAASGARVVMGVIGYTGVDQAAPTGTLASATGLQLGADGNPSVDVSSASGEMVVDALARRSTLTATAGAGQTERVSQNPDITDASLAGLNMSEEAGAATTTMSWTQSGDGRWAILGVPLKPAASSAKTLDLPGALSFTLDMGSGLGAAVEGAATARLTRLSHLTDITGVLG